MTDSFSSAKTIHKLSRDNAILVTMLERCHGSLQWAIGQHVPDDAKAIYQNVVDDAGDLIVRLRKRGNE